MEYMLSKAWDLFREPFDKRKYYLLEQKVCQQTDCGNDAYAKQSVGGG